MEKISVVSIDDNKGIQQALKLAFSRNPMFELKGQAMNGREGIALVEAVRPRIALVDISMEPLNGIQTAECLRQVAPLTKIIAFSSETYLPLKQRMIEAGAIAFISKDAPLKELFASMESLFS